jgi:N utilization substance protein B
MKSRNDPRHQKREHLLQELFAWEYRKNDTTAPDQDIAGIVNLIEKVDIKIREGAPLWPLENMAKVDLSILRLAVWELYYSGQDVPEKVVIDEAIELGKEYGSDQSGAFINGALGAIIKNYPVSREE